MQIRTTDGFVRPATLRSLIGTSSGHDRLAALIVISAQSNPCFRISAGALVTEGKSFPDNSLIVGSPARAIRTLDEKAIAQIRAGDDHYVRRSRQYAEGLKRVG